MTTNSITMQPTGTDATTALVWQPSARKHGAVVEGVLCLNYLPSDNPVGILAREIRARLESAVFGGRSDNQN